MTIIASTLTTATEKGHSLMAGMAFAPNGNLTARGGCIAGLALTKTSGMGFAIGTGRGGVQYTTVPDGGVIPFSVTAAESASFDPGDSVKDRIDLIYATISGGTVAIGVLKGDLPSSGSPVAKATPADSEALYRVLIPAGTSVGSGGWNTANITDVRRWPAFGQDVGDVKFTARSTAPDGWLIAAGQVVSRTVYADLFAAVGTAFGAGDGSTTFALPDLRGRALMGYKAGDTNFGTLGASGGSATHTHGVGSLRAALQVLVGKIQMRVTGSSTYTITNQLSGTGAGDAGSGASGVDIVGALDTVTALPPFSTLTPIIKI